MDGLRRIYKNIGTQLGGLTPSQKLAIGSVLVVMLMTLFLVSRYAGSPAMVPVAAGASAEEQARIAAYLEGRGIGHRKSDNGTVVVPAGQEHALKAQLAQGGALPADKKLLFDGLFDGQSWMRSRGELDQRYTLALSNELAKIIGHFTGIRGASVMISVPDGRGAGLGVAARKPTAQVNVFTGAPGSAGGGARLDQNTVDALADLVAGSVSGLEVADIKIVDGTTRTRYRAGAAGDFAASTYLEQAAKVEERVQNKITEHLAPFIPSVIVSVNAMVDASRKEMKTDTVLPKGEGTVSLPSRESTTTAVTSDSAGPGAEPGPASNVQMDISRPGSGSGSGRSTTSTETGDTEFENAFGRRSVHQLDPQGKPLKINVSVSVPKDYVVAILAQKSGGVPPAAGAAPAAPTDDEITKAWDEERTRIEGMLRPLIETETSGGTPGAAQATAGNLMVSLIPVAMIGTGVTGGGNAAGMGGWLNGGGDGSDGILGGGLVKQVALGGLAAVALGLMLLMVRKAGRPTVLPTAEELVGVPPALEPGSNLIGEADEGDTAMPGIEMDDNDLKTGKMLEQVTELVKTNPGSAAGVFSKWLAPEG